MQLAPPAPEPEPPATPESAPEPQSAHVFAPEPDAAPDERAGEEPKSERFVFADEPAREVEPPGLAAEASQPLFAPEKPAPLPFAPLPDGQMPQTVGEIFGQPDKTEWKPAEIVENIVRLPQIAGAIVALQEGLVVAHHLPEGMKGEVVAAFLPQIFARLNQYASEMKLGELDDLLFSTHGAHMQIFRLGYVFFAVLGKPGEALPWHELNLISQELARHVDR
jgi:predicted regulator of Ras-like GTPase activity (Roadblock/LC7/MglB family)